MPKLLAAAVNDRVAYNRLVACVGRYSLATTSQTELRLHRLVQTVIHARLGLTGEQTWAATAVDVIRAAFPNTSWEVASWRECERLLPHLLATTAHAQRLNVAGEKVGWLLDRASAYLRVRRPSTNRPGLSPNRQSDVTTIALGADHPEAAWRHDELGRVLQELGDLAGAREHLERALRIGEAAFGPDHSSVAIWRGGLGRVLQELGDLAGAREHLERALRIGEAAFGSDHRGVGVRRNNLGSVLKELGDLAGAREQFEQALRISEAALGPDHPVVGVGRNNLGSVLRELGDLAGARDQLEWALRISEAALGPDHPDVSVRRSNLGSVLRELGIWQVPVSSSSRRYGSARLLSAPTIRG